MCFNRCFNRKNDNYKIRVKIPDLRRPGVAARGSALTITNASIDDHRTHHYDGDMDALDITISTKSVFLEAQSSPENNFFIWMYEITILNNSEQIVQLLHRHWKITDLNGKIEEVSGPGVIGLQPLIKPGKSFSYSSFCQLTTPQGTMGGYYEMQNLDEEKFKVEIPEFTLISPMKSKSVLH